jgi:hypothetical protein
MKHRTSMLVTFTRTGERRYAVRAAVEGETAVEMSPAPGYDALMPHDLQHFIVERALRIEGGVFGQLAAGGTAGTFHVIATSGTPRERSREARKRARRGAKLIAQQEDQMRSERAAYICWHHWLSRANDPALRAKARRMDATVRSMLEAMPADERASYSPAKLAEIHGEFQRLSERWSKLKVGESFTEIW